MSDLLTEGPLTKVFEYLSQSFLNNGAVALYELENRIQQVVSRLLLQLD